MHIEYDNGHYDGDVDFSEERSGRGTMHWLGGDWYEGEWINDYMSGNGENYWADGNWYKGQWKNGWKW